MRKFASVLLSCAVLIELLSALVAGFANCAWQWTAWSETRPLPYVAWLALVSFALWLILAVRVVALGPLLAFFTVEKDGKKMIVCAPLYPENLFGGNAIVLSQEDEKQGEPPPPPDDTAPVG